jgi:hypothetical protein
MILPKTFDKNKMTYDKKKPTNIEMRRGFDSPHVSITAVPYFLPTISIVFYTDRHCMKIMDSRSTTIVTRVQL